VVPPPSLGHRRFFAVGLARGHPDSGEAAIMGVPSPHLVLPLSGCLSRHTPTRATRGEARGHRSVLAQNSLLMYPLLFLPLDWSSARCVLARWWTGSHCLCAAVGTFLSGVVRSRYLLDMWFAEGHTARLFWLCLRCVFIASRCGCRPASGMSTPSRCRASAHNQMSVALCPSCAQWLCEFAIDDQSGRTTMVTPADRGGLGEAMLRPDRTLMYLCCCDCGFLRSEGFVQHGDTPL